MGLKSKPGGPVTAALPIQLDRSSPVPLYHQLAEQLTAAITDGRLRPGDPFENEIGMSDRLSLSRPTVRRAISELVNQGLLVRRRGIGTTVANQMVHRKAELTSLYDDLAREGRTPRTEVLSLDCAAHDDRAAAVLELPSGTPLVSIVRLRYADDLPLAIMRNWLPPALNDLTPEQLTTDGLYAVLRARGIRPTVARQRIGARNATAEERRTLQMSKAEPLVTMTRSAYAADGSPVEYGNHCYRADQYSVDVVVSER
jgi:DNA-binding GntR family transcriptional regulator